MFLCNNLHFLGRGTPEGCCAAKGDDAFVKCIHYLICIFIGDIFRKRVSPLKEEVALVIRASPKDT